MQPSAGSDGIGQTTQISRPARVRHSPRPGAAWPVTATQHCRTRYTLCGHPCPYCVTTVPVCPSPLSPSWPGHCLLHWWWTREKQDSWLADWASWRHPWYWPGHSAIVRRDRVCWLLIPLQHGDTTPNMSSEFHEPEKSKDNHALHHKSIFIPCIFLCILHSLNLKLTNILWNIERISKINWKIKHFVWAC